MSERVNYDQIAPTFDTRYAHGLYDDLLEVLRALIEAEQPARVLEAGCGTGYWVAALGDLAPRIYGLDFSHEMLRKARERNRSGKLVRANACVLPFRDRSFDLIFCVNALHHFEHFEDFIIEARRVLRPGGMLVNFGMDPHHGRDSWCVYDYFPETRAIDLARYASSGAIMNAALRAGFDTVQCRTACRFAANRVGRRVFEDPELERRGCSQMALLSDEQYAAGIARMKAVIAAAQVDTPPVFRADIAMMMHCARVGR
jgi:ubiquinone/menaquinone biosynthesis C-methylase UbiE